ncbi:MAG: glutathione S-transferase family protein [Neisseriaceae bacterium]|nr:glutathione S-transferase family protein [Neisseriaceae bacterium]
MLTLYTLPGACSTADHIALIWANVPHQVKTVTRNDLKSPTYLAKNSSGAVPLLEEGDWVLTQNLAILTYVAALAPAARLGAEGDARSQAEFYRALGYLNTDFHGSFKPVFGAERMGADADQTDQIRAQGAKTVADHLAKLDQQLAGNHYFFGGRRTVCDAYLWVMLGWVLHVMPGVLPQYPNVQAYHEFWAQDAGVQAALKAEGLLG